MLTHLSLFSGIGGIDLAADFAGFNTIAQVENNEDCRKVLKIHWPGVKKYGDIRKFKWNKGESVTLITGGFPCQPFSIAGQQRGKEDNRYLWPEMLRIISEARPTWVVAENVANIIRLALGDVLSNLESEGYETDTYLVPACACNAYHRRDRVFIIAHDTNIRYDIAELHNSEDYQKENENVWPGYNGWHEINRYPQVEDGIIEQQSMAFKPYLVPLVYGFPARMVDRYIEMTGNAVVPQQVYPILKAIADIENSK